MPPLLSPGLGQPAALSSAMVRLRRGLLVVALLAGLGGAAELRDVTVELASAKRYETAPLCAYSPGDGCRGEFPATLVFKRAASGTATLRLRFADSERTAYLFDDNGLVQVAAVGDLLVGSFWEGRLAEVHRGSLVMLTRESPWARAADASALALIAVALLGLALFARSFLGGLASRQSQAAEAAREHTLPIRLRGSATAWYWSVGVAFGILAVLSVDPLQHPLSGIRTDGLVSLAILFVVTVVLFNGVGHMSDIDIDASGISHRGLLLRMKRIEFSDMASMETQPIPRGGTMLFIVRRNGRRELINTLMLSRTARAILAEALARGAPRAYGSGTLERWRIGHD